MSLRGAELDPIMMSATVMSIGFSVDIPSHIAYHYYQTGWRLLTSHCSFGKCHFHHNDPLTARNESSSGKEFTNVRDRLEQTVAAVGFPILQASLSTTLCVLSLFFVKLHMSQVRAVQNQPLYFFYLHSASQSMKVRLSKIPIALKTTFFHKTSHNVGNESLLT